MTTKVLAALGFVASAVIALLSYHAGTTVVLSAGIGRPGVHGSARWIYLIALSVLFVCWLLLGRDVLRHENPQRWQPIAVITALWALPIVFAAPLGSRDVWAYGGQADLYRNNVNPYAHGPIAVAGRYLPYISTEWRDQASPYGPVWMVLAAAIVGIAGSHVLVMVIATRIVCALGLALIVLTLPRLARTFGGSPATAVWLCCANPVLVVVALGGPHNDLLVGGLVEIGRAHV